MLSDCRIGNLLATIMSSPPPQSPALQLAFISDQVLLHARADCALMQNPADWYYSPAFLALWMLDHNDLGDDSGRPDDFMEV